MEIRFSIELGKKTYLKFEGSFSGRQIHPDTTVAEYG